MNHKEALKEIEYALEKLKTHVAWAVDMEALKVAKKALEIQIPKKPIVIDKWHMCPTCYEKYGFSYDILVGTKGYKSGEVHCHNCGQLINMEVKE